MNGFILAISVLLLQAVNYSGAAAVKNPVGKCPTDSGEQLIMLPHENDCNKFFVCNRGEAVPSQCAAGLHFNPQLMVCDYPDRAGCGEGGGEGEPAESNEEEDGDEGEPTESNEIPAEESEEDDHLGQEVGECPEVDGEFVTLLPHKSDCTRFFQCNQGTPVVKSCYPGLHFNPTLLVCDYPAQAGCGEGGDEGEPAESNEEEDGDEGEPTESNEIPAEESEEEDHLGQEVGECPEVDGEFVTLLPHKSDCTRFFQCNQGTPVVKSCYPGLHFNPTLLVCDYPDQAGCGDDGGPTEEPTEECEESDEDYDQGQHVGECPEVDGEYVTLLPHNYDCTKFFICNEGTPIVTKCNSNLHFNRDLKVCDYPENAGCLLL